MDGQLGTRDGSSSRPGALLEIFPCFIQIAVRFTKYIHCFLWLGKTIWPGPFPALHVQYHVRQGGGHPSCRMSMQHLHAAYPCCKSLLHDPAACPICVSMLHSLAACPCFMSISCACILSLLHVNLHFCAACPWCISASCLYYISTLHVHAACPYCMSVLHVYSASHVCMSKCKSMLRVQAASCCFSIDQFCSSSISFRQTFGIINHSFRTFTPFRFGKIFRYVGNPIPNPYPAVHVTVHLYSSYACWLIPLIHPMSPHPFCRQYTQVQLPGNFFNSQTE